MSDAMMRANARGCKGDGAGGARGAPPWEGWVYFVADDACRVKIGHTKSAPSSRLGSLQTGHPEKLEVMAFLPGSRATEARFHRSFAGARLVGEWFSGSDELWTLIIGITAVNIALVSPAQRRSWDEDALRMFGAIADCPEILADEAVFDLLPALTGVELTAAREVLRLVNEGDGAPHPPLSLFGTEWDRVAHRLCNREFDLYDDAVASFVSLATARLQERHGGLQ